MGFFSFNRAGSAGADWAIVGLGNPEAKYNGTRHNAGFAALDYLAKQWACPVNRAKWSGLYGLARIDGKKVLLLKPMTYMNDSGRCVGPAAAFYRLPPQKVLVLCDDITQAPGHIRIRANGSAGGHNGLKSIIHHLGSEDFPRLRIGVGAKPNPEYDLAAWVLSKFPPADAASVAARYADIEQACRLILNGDLPGAQNRFNG